MPVTSPTAHTPPAARQRSSTTTAAGSIRAPVASSPSPSIRGLRPEATTRRSARTSAPSAKRTVTPPSCRRRPWRCRPPRGQGDPVVLQGVATCPRAQVSCRGSGWPSGSASVTSQPSRASICASSTPTGPAPRTTAPAGTRVSVVASRLVQASTSVIPSSGGIAGAAPVAITTRAVDSRRPSISTAPGPASRPRPRTTSMPASNPWGLLGVVEAGGHVLQVRRTCVEAIAGSATPGVRRASARTSPDAAGSSWGCMPRTGTHRRRPRT